MKKRTKLLTLLLTLALSIATIGATAGCNNDETTQNNSSSSSIENTTPDTNTNKGELTPPDQNEPIPPTNPSSTKGLEYTLSEDETYYSVKGYTCTDTAVYIPDVYNGLPIKEIGNYAFWNCDSLTEIIIPDSVTSISSCAFSSCDNLTEITVSANNTAYQSIDGNLYSKDGKTLIQYAIGKKATSFTIPDSVTSIGYDAFSGCSSLTEIVIPDSVTFICDYAFSGCSSLTEIVIPDSVTVIGYRAFYGCSSLTSATCHAFTIEHLPENQITTVVITSGAIYNSAFFCNRSLTSVTIGNGVTSIGRRAFYGCDSLTEIIIPDSVTSIGDSAFYGCDSLTIYCEEESKPDGWASSWNSSNCSVVWGYKA